MAGLCVAARARELGVTPTVLEKGSRPGGSMLLSSAVIWRYRSLDDFRRECPTGDPRLQRLIVEQLDDALDWLKSLGAPLVSAETANARTVGRRFDPRGLTDVLARAAGDVRMGHALGSDPGTGLEEPLVLATGGFPIRLAREHGLAMRSNPWSEGDGLELGLAAGAATTPGMDEFYGRAMPAPPARWGEEEFVDHAQLYGHLARVFDDSGEGIAVKDDDWSENGLVQEIARRGGRAPGRGRSPTSRHPSRRSPLRCRRRPGRDARRAARGRRTPPPPTSPAAPASPAHRTRPSQASLQPRRQVRARDRRPHSTDSSAWPDRARGPAGSGSHRLRARAAPPDLSRGLTPGHVPSERPRPPARAHPSGRADRSAGRPCARSPSRRRRAGRPATSASRVRRRVVRRSAVGAVDHRSGTRAGSRPASGSAR